MNQSRYDELLLKAACEEMETSDTRPVAVAYGKIKQQADATEQKMNELYTIIDGMDKTENQRFMAVYEEFNKLLVEFHDMLLTVQQVVNGTTTDTK